MEDQLQKEYERGFVDGMQKQMQSSVDKAVNAMAQSKSQLQQRTGDCLLTGVCAAEGHHISKAQSEQNPIAWLYTNKLGGRQVSLIDPPADMKDQYQPLYLATPKANYFNPDWDAMPVMIEEQRRMVKRIEELEAQLGEAMWGYGEWRRKAESLMAEASVAKKEIT